MLFNARQAKKNRDFQANMYGSRYQMAVADLRKAGLNPILAAQGLGGGSSPGGATAAPADLGNPIADGQQAALAHATRKKVKADEALTKRQRDFVDKQIEGQEASNARLRMENDVKKLETDWHKSKTGQDYIQRRLRASGLPSMAGMAEWASDLLGKVGYSGYQNAQEAADKHNAELPSGGIGWDNGRDYVAPNGRRYQFRRNRRD